MWWPPCAPQRRGARRQFSRSSRASRLTPSTASPAALQEGRDWLWIAGNHDPASPGRARRARPRPNGTSGRWSCATSPGPDRQPGEIAGHLHPVALVAGSGGAVRRRAFVSDATRCVMPAFGAYAGGLNMHDAAFTALFGGVPRYAHALGRDRVFAVAGHRCLPER